MKSEKEFLEVLNKEILSKYGIVCDGIGIERESVLAYYSLSTRTIHINRMNKQIFNDYFQFIETMIHENVHAINHAKGIRDVEMEGEAQIHIQSFRDTMQEKYDMYCDNGSFTGSVILGEKRNENALSQLMRNKFIDKKVFGMLQDYFLDNIFVETTDRDNKYEDNGKKYIFDDEKGQGDLPC